MNAWTIRPATPDDIPAITANYRREVETGVATFELVPPDAADMADRMQRIVDGGFPYLVAERDGAFLGNAYAGPYRTRPAYSWTVEDSIYLAPEAQGIGLGRALLAAIIEESASRGFRQMVAVITGAEPPVSVRLHAALGFVEAGTLRSVGYKFGRWLDTVTMVRPLGIGDGSPPTPRP